MTSHSIITVLAVSTRTFRSHWGQKWMWCKVIQGRRCRCWCLKSDIGRLATCYFRCLAEQFEYWIDHREQFRFEIYHSSVHRPHTITILYRKCHINIINFFTHADENIAGVKRSSASVCVCVSVCPQHIKNEWSKVFKVGIQTGLGMS